MVEMRILRWINAGVTRENKIINEYIVRQYIRIALVVDKIQQNILKWLSGHKERKDGGSKISKIIICRRKRIESDMKRTSVSDEDVENRVKWTLRTERRRGRRKL